MSRPRTLSEWDRFFAPRSKRALEYVNKVMAWDEGGSVSELKAKKYDSEYYPRIEVRTEEYNCVYITNTVLVVPACEITGGEITEWLGRTKAVVERWHRIKKILDKAEKDEKEIGDDLPQTDG